MDTFDTKRFQTEHFNKWDKYPKGCIPLFLADMDFPSSPAIRKALEKSAKAGFYNYAWSSLEELATIANTVLQHNLKIQTDQILFSHGLIHGMDTILRSLSQAGDEIIFITPEYPSMFSIANLNQLIIKEIPLIEDSQDKSLTYALDLHAIEAAISPQTKFILFSSPHNPCGTVFKWKELADLARLCLKHSILMISDEIWSPLILDDSRFISTGSLSEEVSQNCITLISPSKAYNLGGLAGGLIIIPNPDLLKTVKSDYIAHPSIQSHLAFLAAYQDNDQWLTEKITLFNQNKNKLIQFFNSTFPSFKISIDPATYLLWVKTSYPDASQWCEALEKEQGVVLQKGKNFGKDFSAYFRLSFATEAAVLEEACRRMKAFEY